MDDHSAIVGGGWVWDTKGIPRRTAARVVLFDRDLNVLLVRGHDKGNPKHTFWFTIGGGVKPGETPGEAAARELAEETGLTVWADRLIGPVATREGHFHFASGLAIQDETFYLAHYPKVLPATSTGRLSANEKETLDEFRWFDAGSLKELAREEEIYPRELVSLIQGWMHGWDRDVVHIPR